MKWRPEGAMFVIIMETGDEIISSLQVFARENKIQGAFFFGLGAAKNCTLGYYDLAAGNYLKKTIHDQQEIVSLIGNVSLVEGEPFVHCHIQIGDAGMNVKGGHLFKGYVSPTCEIMLFPSEKALERKEIPGQELKMIKL